MKNYFRKFAELVSPYFRVRLRTLLITFTLIGIFTGMFGYRVQCQKSAVRWVNEHGGSIIYDYSWVGHGAFGTPRAADWLCDIFGIDTFASVYSVDLENAQIDSIEPISKFVHLNRIYALNSTVSDIQPLTDLDQLHELNLGGTNVTDYSPILNHHELLHLIVPDSISDQQFEILTISLPNCCVARESEDRDTVRER